MTDNFVRTRLTKRITLHYAAAFFIYFAAFCMIRSFISLYLLEKGFSYTQVGIISGIHMMTTAAIQPSYTAILNRFPKLGLKRFIAICCIPAMMCSLLTFILPANLFLYILIYILLGFSEIGLQSLMVSIGMEYVNAGIPINAGLGRGMGSVGYAAANLVLGFLIVRYGSPISQKLNIALLLLLVVLIMTLPDLKVMEPENDSDDRRNKMRADNFITFLRGNQIFTLFIFSLVLLFFSHSIVNTYMPNVAGQFGLGSDFTGLLNSIAAFLELIPMMLFTQISKRISPLKMLYISAVFFSIKILTATIARSPAGLILSQSMQIMAYALFAMSSIYFANHAVRPHNRVMAQGLLIGANEAGFTLGGLLGGVILDHASIRVLLWSGVAVSILGSLLMITALKRFENQEQNS